MTHIPRRALSAAWQPSMCHQLVQCLPLLGDHFTNPLALFPFSRWIILLLSQGNSGSQKQLSPSSPTRMAPPEVQVALLSAQLSPFQRAFSGYCPKRAFLIPLSSCCFTVFSRADMHKRILLPWALPLATASTVEAEFDLFMPRTTDRC